MKNLLKLVAFSVLVVTLASCAKAPQAEIDAANVAIEAAKTAGADRYVPESFNAASEALKSAVTAVEEQNSKFVLFRNYDAAKTTLASVNTLAGKAVEETTAKKAALKAEVTAALAEIATVVASNKELLAKAPKGKEGKAALEAIGQEIAAVETISTEVTAGVTNNEDILTLAGKVKPAVEKAKSINTELTDVIEKAKSKGGKKKK
ncbi:MAG: DUF4398 domain-containing protein [Bacteroidia bacterium]|nr:DUF4398 domain-containing protein [Bacteroidia bacterium]